MPVAVKEFFRKRTLCCYDYKDLPQATEKNMFQLVQRGLALTPAEKMRAKSTEWAKLAKQYEEDYLIVVNCKPCLNKAFYPKLMSEKYQNRIEHLASELF